MPIVAVALAILLGDVKEAEEALSKFSAAFKAKEVEARVAAVVELAQTQHEKVHSKLGALLLTDVREVRVAAAKGLGGAEENKKKIQVYLTSGFLANQSDLALEAVIIESLDKIKEGLGRATLENIFKAGDVETAKTAINTVGEYRKKELVGALIAYDKLLDARAKEYLSAGPVAKGYLGRGLYPGGGPTVDSEAPKRAKLLGPVIHQVLYAVTGMKLTTSSEWDDWWDKNKSTFKFP